MPKYKIYHRLGRPIALNEYPFSRLLNFKRSKWLSLKKKIIKQHTVLERVLNKNKKFKKFSKTKRSSVFQQKRFKKPKNKKKNSGSLFCTRRRLMYPEKVKKAFKNGLILKYRMFQFFGSSFSLKYFKRLALTKRDRFQSFFLKSFFKLDILLWKLKFFKSIKEVQQYIRTKNIYVNGVCITNTQFFLRKGDAIKILNKKFNFFKKNILNISFLLSFCDIDFYTHEIILLKGIKDMCPRDSALIFESYINLSNFIYYIKRA